MVGVLGVLPRGDFFGKLDVAVLGVEGVDLMLVG